MRHRRPTELRRTAWGSTTPGAVVVSGPPDAPGVPLLEGCPLVNGNPAVHVCHGFTCDAPVTSAADPQAALAVRLGDLNDRPRR